MIFALIKKDLTEHSWTMLLLSAGVLVCVLIALRGNQQLVIEVSSLQLVHTALISLLPMITIIMGQRLITAEYLGKTQLFVESLPIRGGTLVSAKFLFGLIFTAILAALVLGIVAYSARSVDSIDLQFILLLSLKTFTMSTLIWSIVFCLSFCGFIRIALYITIIFVILNLVVNPSFDAAGFGPFSLMDSQLFAFERDEYPWQDLIETWGITLFFTVVGFSLALFNEGSVAELLAKPLSRRDVVLTGLVVFVGLLLLGELQHDPPDAISQQSTSHVLRSTDPQVSVAYRSAENEVVGQQTMSVILAALRSMREALGIGLLPEVRIVHDNSLAASEVQIDAAEGVNMRANFNGKDLFSVYTLATVVLHETLQHLAVQRLSFEPYHWMLDGFARWWVESQFGALNTSSRIQQHHTELMALASYALEQLDDEWTLATHWQIITDRVGYPAAEAMAYSAMVYLVAQSNVPTVEKLAISILLPPRSNSSLATFQHWLHSPADQFAQTSGLDLASFFSSWRLWLKAEAESGPINALLKQLPKVLGEVKFSAQSKRTMLIDLSVAGVSTAMAENNGGQTSERCRLQYETVTPFDHEMEPVLEEQFEFSCNLTGRAVAGKYSSGDRVYIVLEHMSPIFHMPIRLWQNRVNIP